MEYKKLGDIATYINGYAFKPEDRGTEGLPIIRIQDLTGNAYDLGFYDGKHPEKIEINNGDVLISWSASLGVYVWNRGKALLNQHIFKVAFNKVDVDKNYFVYAVRHKLNEMAAKAHGATMKHIIKKDFDAIQIPFPSLQEQAEISLILDKVAHVIEERREELSKLDTLIKARFVEMFGDPETNSKGWAEIPLSEKLNVLGGYAFKSDQFEETGGIPVLRIGNINSGYFKPVNMVYWKEERSLERYAMYPGDLVMSLTGTVGKDDYGNVCILGNTYEMYYLNQRNAKLELKDGLDKYYLAELLKFSQVKKKLTGISRGVRQANISNKDILNLVAPIPPMKLQQQFAAFVAQIDKSKLLSGCRLFHSWAPENRDKPKHVGMPRQKTKGLRGRSTPTMTPADLENPEHVGAPRRRTKDLWGGRRQQ